MPGLHMQIKCIQTALCTVWFWNENWIVSVHWCNDFWVICQHGHPINFPWVNRVTKWLLNRMMVTERTVPLISKAFIKRSPFVTFIFFDSLTSICRSVRTEVLSRVEGIMNSLFEIGDLKECLQCNLRSAHQRKNMLFRLRLSKEWNHSHNILKRLPQHAHVEYHITD